MHFTYLTLTWIEKKIDFSRNFVTLINGGALARLHPHSRHQSGMRRFRLWLSSSQNQHSVVSAVAREMQTRMTDSLLLHLESCPQPSGQEEIYRLLPVTLSMYCSRPENQLCTDCGVVGRVSLGDVASLLPTLAEFWPETTLVTSFYDTAEWGLYLSCPWETCVQLQAGCPFLGYRLKSMTKC